MNIKKSDSPVGKGSGVSTKSIGMFEGRVIAINPSQAEIAKIFNVEEEKITEPEYINEDNEGNTRANIVVWVEDVKSKQTFQYRFSVTDKIAESKSGNKMYINAVGDYSYQPKDQLQDWFKHFLDKDKNVIGDKDIREGYVGEQNIYQFVKAWLTKGTNFFDPETNLFMDVKKLFRGNFKELSDLVKSEYTNTVLFCATIRTNNEGKTFQSVWKDILPGYLFEKWTGEKIGNRHIDRFIDSITDSEYGCKDTYSLNPLEEFKEVPA